MSTEALELALKNLREAVGCARRVRELTIDQEGFGGRAAFNAAAELEGKLLWQHELVTGEALTRLDDLRETNTERISEHMPQLPIPRWLLDLEEQSPARRGPIDELPF